MQFSSYVSPCYFIPSAGRPLPHGEGDVTWMSRNGCNSLVQPSSFNHYQIYEKEFIRQTMLNHEAAFRYQVRELHRLYKRQNELMAEYRMRELSVHQLQVQRSQSDWVVNAVRQDISQKTVTPWSFVNAEDCVSSLPSERYLQRPSFAEYGLQSDNNSFLTKRSPSDNEGLHPKINKFGKRMIDLELPADLYVDSDEEDNSICYKSIGDVPPTLRSLAKDTPEFHQESDQPNTFDTTGSLNINSSCRGTKLCIDLNESILLDDESYSASHLKSVTCSTQTVHLSPVPSRKPVKESEASNGDNVLNDMSPEENQVEHQPLNSEAVSDEVILVQHSSAKGTSLSSNISCESHDSPKTFGSSISCSPQLVPYSADSDIKALSSVTSQRRPPSDFREVPLAVQALPCFNNTKATKGPKSAYSSSRNRSGKLMVKKNSENSADIGKEPFQARRRLSKRMKNLHDHELLECVDLNCMPPDFESLPGIDSKEDHKAPHSTDLTISGTFVKQPPLPCPTSGKSVPSMSDDNEEVGDNARSSCDTVSVNNDEANLAKLNNCKQLSCSKDEPPAASSQSSTVIKLQGTKGLNVEASVSPQNSECHPPRGESDTFELPRYLRKEDELNVGERDKIAAEAILFMSSSLSSMTPEPSGPLVSCLNWFAGIASSVSEDLCSEIKELSNKSAVSDDQEHGSLRATNCETKKARVKRINDASCRGKKQNEKEATEECVPRLQGHGRRSKQPKILKQKSLHAIGMERRIDVVAFNNVKRRKRNTGNSFAKRRPLIERSMYSSSICNAKSKTVGNCLQGWGSGTGRRKARRARMVFDVFLLELSFTNS